MITMIACVDENNVLGDGDTIPWHCSKDFKFFKETTAGQSVIMGRATYDSMIPYFKGEVLPGRTKYVVTRSVTPEIIAYFADKSVTVITPETIQLFAQETKEYFIIGGAQVYCAYLPIASRVLLTRIYGLTLEPSDTSDFKYFPYFEYKDGWEIVGEENVDDINTVTKSPVDLLFTEFKKENDHSARSICV